MTNEQDWRTGLKVGDEVAVVGGSWITAGVTLEKVSSVHVRHILIGLMKYRKDSGWQVGDGHHRGRIEFPSDEHRQRAHRQQLVLAFSYLKATSLTTDQLARIIAIAKEPKEQAEDKSNG